MNDISVVGLDLAKHVFQIHAVDAQGNVVQRKQLRRSQVMEYFTRLKPCLIGMEACESMHYWARELESLGHTTKAMAPVFVKPYLKSNKNDRNDAEAICEAVQRPSMRFVEIKTPEQQAILQLHHARQKFVRERVVLNNHMRSVLAEHGIVIARGPKALSELAYILEDADNGLPNVTRQLLATLKQAHDVMLAHSKALLQQIEAWHKTNANSQLLQTIPGIGVLTATALSAHIGQASGFRNGRQLAAYLGLVPRQASTGGKQRLLGISKRGNGYIRSLLVHGARAVISHINKRLNSGRPGGHPWVEQLLARCHINKVCVALANKMVRIAWKVLTSQSPYRKSLTVA